MRLGDTETAGVGVTRILTICVLTLTCVVTMVC